MWCGGLVPWLTECELGQSLMILALYQSAKHQESLYVLHHNQVKEEGDLPGVKEKRFPNLIAKITSKINGKSYKS